MRKEYYRISFLLLSFIFLLTSHCTGEGLNSSIPVNSDNSERILIYRTEIVVHEDASLTIKELIRVRATGAQIKRGIYRDFPYTNNSNVDFKIKKVLRDNRLEPYFTQKISNGTRLYIGKEDIYLAPGDYTYSITYSISRQIVFKSDYDELLWNAIGSWSFVIDQASVVVSLPSDASKKIISYGAYISPNKQKGSYYTFTRDEKGILNFIIIRPMQIGETLTIKLDWPKGYLNI
jgi:hypothetical protein